MRNTLITTFAVAVSLIVPLPVTAHHGNAAFDVGKEITLKGTVTEWFWANPHCILQFDLKDKNGQVEHWITETSNPPDMIATGWTKTSFKSGDQVIVTAQPVKSGKPVGRLLQVVLPNGKTLSTFGGAKGAVARSAAAGAGAPDEPKVEEIIPGR
jgi:hypothetical protein